jgi:UDP-N-acetylmuramoyl-L-alanyl-D-glutamate--2,6-diaminopimelate ligase
VDHLYLTADDPDFEDPASICAQMQDAMREPSRATVIPDRRTAILRAVREMRPFDLLLILAKPYPIGQLVGGRYLPFDERAAVKEALAEF